MSLKILILDNIRSAHNVGSIFRTADGAGVKKIYLVGVTPCPIDRFGRIQPEIMKTSLGATNMIPWQQVSAVDAVALVEELQSQGFAVVAIEQTAASISLETFKVPEKVAYIFGNEIGGVAETLLVAADSVVDIPMKGKKESLNVSVTAGIVLFNRG